MQVSIIIINYNTFELTCNCIASIYQHTIGVDFEIILVDNASTKNNPDDFLTRFPSIKLIKSSINGGFAKGNNIGLQAATGRYILLLNSDTYFTENTLAKTLAFAQEKGNAIIGVRMTYENGAIQYTARKYRSILWEWLDLLRFIPLLLPYKQRATIMLGKYFNADFTTIADWLNGAFFWFPKQILLQLPNNQLDERFFMYGEDQLWCYQFSKLGYNSIFFHNTTIVHINNGSSNNQQKKLQLILTMLQHELLIMQERKGKGLYYYLFCSIYLPKEYGRYYIKWLWLKISGKLIR